MRRLLHISDLHFGRIDPATPEPLQASAARLRPDLVIVSGDLTQRARAWQFREARDYLATLPKPQLVVPGNHDVPLYDVFSRFLRPLSNYRRYITDELEPWYRDEEIAVVGINTARSLAFKGGRINQLQVGRVRERLCELDPKVIRVIVTHHPFDLPEGRSLGAPRPGRNGDLDARAGRAELLQRSHCRPRRDRDRAARVATPREGLHPRGIRSLPPLAGRMGACVAEEGCRNGNRGAGEPRIESTPTFFLEVAAMSEAESVPARGRFGATQRRDAWWLELLPVVILLGLFGIYATARAFEGRYYEWGPYLSPFYSPLIDPEHRWWPFSPAILILAGPLGFRATCYYYRKAYYRAFFLDPPACAVGEGRHRYRGETAFPFILQNVHRFFLYLAVLFLFFLWYDAAVSFRFDDGFGVGVGSLVLTANVALLSLYTFSCHSLRHLVGGKVDCFSCSASGRARHGAWRWVTALNERHGLFAWFSLISVAIADLYVRSVACGALTDVRLL